MKGTQRSLACSLLYSLYSPLLSICRLNWAQHTNRENTKEKRTDRRSLVEVERNERCRHLKDQENGNDISFPNKDIKVKLHCITRKNHVKVEVNKLQKRRASYLKYHLEVGIRSMFGLDQPDAVDNRTILKETWVKTALDSTISVPDSLRKVFQVELNELYRMVSLVLWNFLAKCFWLFWPHVSTEKRLLWISVELRLFSIELIEFYLEHLPEQIRDGNSRIWCYLHPRLKEPNILSLHA